MEYAVVTTQSSGIHPSTSRLVSIDILVFNEDGEQIDEYYSAINPTTDIGPFHLHSLRPEDIARAPRYITIARKVADLITDRTLIVHNGPRTWGFIASESSRAVRVARRGRRRRRPMPRMPRPVALIDTLASLRRQGHLMEDTRIRGCAHALGKDVQVAASVERAKLPAAELARLETELVWWMYNQLKDKPLAQRDPATLQADKFGLQRSKVRVAAAELAPRFENPGVLQDRLVQGMEFVVAPEVAIDPNTIIESAVNAGLSYTEKITRQSSVVVCNEREHLRGKAMHGDRKDIPLVTDEDFMRLLEDVAPGRPVEPVEQRSRPRNRNRSRSSKPR